MILFKIKKMKLPQYAPLDPVDFFISTKNTIIRPTQIPTKENTSSNN